MGRFRGSSSEPLGLVYALGQDDYKRMAFWHFPAAHIYSLPLPTSLYLFQSGSKAHPSDSTYIRPRVVRLRVTNAGVHCSCSLPSDDYKSWVLCAARRPNTIILIRITGLGHQCAYFRILFHYKTPVNTHSPPTPFLDPKWNCLVIRVYTSRRSKCPFYKWLISTFTFSFIPLFLILIQLALLFKA